MHSSSISKFYSLSTDDDDGDDHSRAWAASCNVGFKHRLNKLELRASVDFTNFNFFTFKMILCGIIVYCSTEIKLSKWPNRL